MPLYKNRVVKRARSWWRSTRSAYATVNRNAIIILGKEKSGTTAIATLLAKHTGLSLTHDIQALWGRAEMRIRRGEMTFGEFLRRNRGVFANDIIKEPGLTFLYPHVRESFPDARFVMIIRDPRDSLRSLLNRLELPGSLQTLDPGALDRMSAGWRGVIEGESQGFQKATYIEVAAARWNAAADVYLNHKDEMRLVRYEDFVRQKADTIGQLAEALRLPHVNDISEIVDIQYQRGGDRTVSWQDFFGQRNLGMIEAICRSRMREFGYECLVHSATVETQCSNV